MFTAILSSFLRPLLWISITQGEQRCPGKAEGGWHFRWILQAPHSRLSAGNETHSSSPCTLLHKYVHKHTHTLITVCVHECICCHACTHAHLILNETLRWRQRVSQHEVTSENPKTDETIIVINKLDKYCNWGFENLIFAFCKSKFYKMFLPKKNTLARFSSQRVRKISLQTIVWSVLT